MGDTRIREVNGRPEKFVYWVAASWALFHIWYASPLPYTLGFGLFNSTEARSISLAFAIFLGLSSYPVVQRVRTNPIKSWEIVWALLGAGTAAYLFLFYEDISDRAGILTPLDLGVGIVGLVLLVDAARRVVALPIAIGVIGCIGFLLFGSGFGDHTWSNSLDNVIRQLWHSSEGVFGVILGVALSVGFLGVLLGSGLDRLGFGRRFVEKLFSPYSSGSNDGQRVVPCWLEGRFWTWVFALQFLSGFYYINQPELVPLLGEIASGSALPILLIGSNYLVKYVRGLIGSSTSSWTWDICDILLIVTVILGMVYLYSEQAVYFVLIALAVIAYRRMNGESKNSNEEETESGVATEIKTSAYGIGLIALFSSLLTATLLSVGLFIGSLNINIGQTQMISHLLFLGGVVMLAAIALIIFTKKTSDNRHMPVALFLVSILVLACGQYVFRFSPGLSAFHAVTSCATLIVLSSVVNWSFHRDGSFKTAVLTAFGYILDWMALGGRNAIPLVIGAAVVGIAAATITLTGARL